jgi:hypothetical protein
MNLYTHPTKIHINGLYMLIVPKNGKSLFLGNFEYPSNIDNNIKCFNNLDN